MTELTTLLPFSPRMRRSPFFDRSHAYGAKAYTVYGHMLLPNRFRSAEEDYAHLRRAVQLWDTGAERQVEVRGLDALRLIQMSTPRDVSGMAADRCRYIPVVDADGGLLNDPVLVKVAEDRYWVSLADSDLLFYYKGLAAGFGLDVEVFEPDVAPLGIQGARAAELIERVWGKDAAALRLFRTCRVDVEGMEMILARSGFSQLGRYELYFEGTDGSAIWDRLAEAGRDMDVFAGCPSQIERIEAGLLSYNTDVTIEHDPFEAGLGAFCTMDRDVGCLAYGALMKRRDPARRIMPVEIAGDPIPGVPMACPVTDAAGAPTGRITSVAFSPTYGVNVAMGLIDRAAWAEGTTLTVKTPFGARAATVRDDFWARG